VAVGGSGEGVCFEEVRDVCVFFGGGWRIGSGFTLMSSRLLARDRFPSRFPTFGS
jgi:hypothetical protein